MEKFTPLAKILHCRRQSRHGQIPPLGFRIPKLYMKFQAAIVFGLENPKFGSSGHKNILVGFRGGGSLVQEISLKNDNFLVLLIEERDKQNLTPMPSPEITTSTKCCPFPDCGKDLSKYQNHQSRKNHIGNCKKKEKRKIQNKK